MRPLQHALRQARLHPGFAATVIGTTALTIGAATAIFSLFDAAFLRPFPYPAADRLVQLETYSPKDPGSKTLISLYDFEDYRARNRSFTDAAAYMSWSNQMSTGNGPAQSVHMTFASAGLFELLGVNPVLGRTYRKDEDLPGGPVTKALLSDALWRQQFGASPDAIGKTIRLRGQSFEVIGVMPASFRFPERSQIWVPLHARYAAYQDTWWKRRDARFHKVIARLRDGVSIEQANGEVASLAAVLRQEHPDENLDAHARVLSLRDAEVGEVRPYVWLAAGAGLLLMLLGCTNIANLMIARTLAREREFAVRRALGSGMGDLLSQLLHEALVLTLAGAVIGSVLAYGGVRGFLALLPPENVPQWMRLTLDTRVLLFAVGAAMATAVVAILLPAWQQTRGDLNEKLKEGARGSSSGGSFAVWARRALVVAEISISVVLLAGAGLMIRSFRKAMDTDPGLRPQNLLVVKTGRFVPNVGRAEGVRVYSDEYLRIQRALQDLPGIVDVSAGSDVPFLGTTEKRQAAELYTLKRATREQAFRVPFHGSDVMPHYFSTLGIPVLEGRDFTEQDTIDKPPAVVLGRRTAELLFPGESAIGQKIRYGINQDYDPWAVVVGVAGNIRWNAAEREPGYEIYWSYRQYPGPGFNFLIRTQGDAYALQDIVRRTIQSVNPEVSVDRMVAMPELAAESVWRRRLWSSILSAFAGLALLLAAVGLFGVMSYLVEQQRKEIGIRMALGAPPGTILQWVLTRGMLLALTGFAAGWIAALAFGSQLGDLLWGVSAFNDLPTYALVAGAVLLATVAACAIPALRATATSPTVVLRGD